MKPCENDWTGVCSLHPELAGKSPLNGRDMEEANLVFCKQKVKPFNAVEKGFSINSGSNFHLISLCNVDHSTCFNTY